MGKLTTGVNGAPELSAAAAAEAGKIIKEYLVGENREALNNIGEMVKDLKDSYSAQFVVATDGLSSKMNKLDNDVHGGMSKVAETGTIVNVSILEKKN